MRWLRWGRFMRSHDTKSRVGLFCQFVTVLLSRERGDIFVCFRVASIWLILCCVDELLVIPHFLVGSRMRMPGTRKSAFPDIVLHQERLGVKAN